MRSVLSYAAIVGVVRKENIDDNTFTSVHKVTKPIAYIKKRKAGTAGLFAEQVKKLLNRDEVYVY